MYQYRHYGEEESARRVPYYDCTFPAYLHERQSVRGAERMLYEDFTNPSHKEEDEAYLHAFLRRALDVLKREKARRDRNSPEADGASPPLESKELISFTYNLNHFKSNDFSMRLIVSDFEKFLTIKKHFVVGFFSKKKNLDDQSRIIQKVWNLDDKLVSSLGKFPCINCYITCRKDNGDYVNFVFLDDEKGIDKWKCFTTHDAAVIISPFYYEWVRINHAVLPCSIESILDKEGGEKRLDIIRTKYFLYANRDCVWRGLRKFKCDEVFHSLPEHQTIKPFVFASFLGDNAFMFYKKLVEYIGNTTGLPVKFIDIAGLTSNLDPRPNDLVSIKKYNIDFAFTCGLSYVKFFPNLVALAAPVRREKRYNEEAVYFADIIVNSSSPYKTVDDLKEKTFCINEEISYSGCTAPDYHFRNQGGLKGHFSKVERSGSHANSMNYIRDGKADCAAIDSVVFEMELQQRPERASEFRILETTRATSMPPFAASTWVPLHVQQTVQNALLKVHQTHQRLLNNNGFSKFVEISDEKYDDIRNVISSVEAMREAQKQVQQPTKPKVCPFGFS